MIVIGIDPGDKGAVAILRSDGVMPVVLPHPVQGPRYMRLGADVAACLRLVKELDREDDEMVIVCEKAISIRGRKTSGTVVIGRYVRSWKYIARQVKARFIEVAPRTWQSKLLEKGDTKGMAREFCRGAWGPLTSDWTPDECDAACVAFWGLSYGGEEG